MATTNLNIRILIFIPYSTLTLSQNLQPLQTISLQQSLLPVQRHDQFLHISCKHA